LRTHNCLMLIFKVKWIYIIFLPTTDAFYFGTFTFWFYCHFFVFLFPSILNNDYFEILIPRPFIGVIRSIACAYNFDMWTIIFANSLFSSLVILSVFYISVISETKTYYLFTIILITITQVLFFKFWWKFWAYMGVTEYKEFFIALVLFVYSCDVYFRTKNKVLLKKNNIQYDKKQYDIYLTI
jgi:hypothetical protein